MLHQYHMLFIMIKTNALQHFENQLLITPDNNNTETG